MSRGNYIAIMVVLVFGLILFIILFILDENTRQQIFNINVPSPTPITPTVVPVTPTRTLTPTEDLQTQTVLVYFNNSQKDIQNCDRVFPVQREISQTPQVARSALEELLKGPTNEESNQGYFTNIPSGVRIQKLTIENGTARVDFNQALEQGVGGSCRVAAIRSQIIQTLQQFPTVRNVVISINGRTEDILQP